MRVEGQLIFNGMALMLQAARTGFGLARLLEDIVRADVAAGRLIRVLADWCQPFSGYHLYYPSRRQPSPALRCSSKPCASSVFRANKTADRGR